MTLLKTILGVWMWWCAIALAQLKRQDVIRMPWKTRCAIPVYNVLLQLWANFCWKVKYKNNHILAAVFKNTLHFTPVYVWGVQIYSIIAFFQQVPRRLDKLFWVGSYLFQYLLQGSTQKWMILAIFRLIPSHGKLSCTLYEQIWVSRWSIHSSVASPICQEGQSERTFPIFPDFVHLLSTFIFSFFFPIFGKFFVVKGDSQWLGHWIVYLFYGL